MLGPGRRGARRRVLLLLALVFAMHRRGVVERAAVRDQNFGVVGVRGGARDRQNEVPPPPPPPVAPFVLAPRRHALEHGPLPGCAAAPALDTAHATPALAAAEDDRFARGGSCLGRDAVPRLPQRSFFGLLVEDLDRRIEFVGFAQDVGRLARGFDVVKGTELNPEVE